MGDLTASNVRENAKACLAVYEREEILIQLAESLIAQADEDKNLAKLVAPYVEALAEVDAELGIDELEEEIDSLEGEAGESVEIVDAEEAGAEEDAALPVEESVVEQGPCEDVTILFDPSAFADGFGDESASLELDSDLSEREAAEIELAKAEAELAAKEKASQSVCKNCGGPIGPDDRFCFSCGTPVSAAEMKSAPAVVAPAAVSEKRLCKKCGAEVGEDDLFCSECGTRYEASAAPSVQPAAPVARHCSKCGAVAEDGFLFCGECGTRL